jgi:hypothetical protein
MSLPRFLVYRCSTISQIERDGTQRIGVGLVADQSTGNVLQAGDVHFTYFLLQRQLNRLVTEQEAVERWMPALLPLFEERLSGIFPLLAASSGGYPFVFFAFMMGLQFLVVLILLS